MTIIGSYASNEAGELTGLVQIGDWRVGVYYWSGCYGDCWCADPDSVNIVIGECCFHHIF